MAKDKKDEKKFSVKEFEKALERKINTEKPELSEEEAELKAEQEAEARYENTEFEEEEEAEGIEETTEERSFYSLTHDEVNGLLMKVLQFNTHTLQELQNVFKFNEHHIVNKTISSNNLLMKKMENE